MRLVLQIFVGILISMGAMSTSHAYDHPDHLDPTAMTPSEFAIRDHAIFLNELSNRRRLNTFFPNEQSANYGVPIRYVNTSRGNLTFVRRDLVTVGRIPIVIGRIYDSANRRDTGFGMGWRLSVAETIVAGSNGTYVYVDDSGSEIQLVRRNNTVIARDAIPSEIVSIAIDSERARILFRNGWTKSFRLVGDRFVLVEVRDAYSNYLTLQYQGPRLARIETQNGRAVTIHWNALGRIARATDDQQRTVSYLYDERWLLREATDIGGNEWLYEYDELTRLTAAFDPQGIQLLTVASDASNRAIAVGVLGERYQYRYEPGRTTVRVQANRVISVAHNGYGISMSITGPTGLVSQLRLDERNRVTGIVRDSASGATVSYGANGKLQTVTVVENSEPTTYVYTYDGSNKATNISGNDGSSLTLAYNASGDLRRKQEGTHWTDYEYTAQGDLRVVANSYKTTTYTHNSDGQVVSVVNSSGNTSLTYFPDGKLKSISFPDGATHEYAYNSLGLRQSVVRSNALDIEYLYDSAGNLKRSIGLDASGRDVGQSFELDDAYRALVVRHDNGNITKATYDVSGNPKTIATSEDLAMPRYSYTYDENSRLVAVADGDTIIGSHEYDGTEPDLRDQYDDHTMRIAVDSVRSSSTIGSLHSIAYTRSYGAYLQIAQFNESTSGFELSGEYGLILPDGVRLNSLMRQELLNVDGSVQSRVEFDRPSNVTFLPPEYATINCAQGCVFNGIIVKANGVQGAISVPFGSTVNFTAHKVGQNSCDLLICNWYKNGVWAGFGTPSTWQHTFTSPGAYTMTGSCECSPCDFFDYQSVTVSVAPCANGVALVSQTVATIPANQSRTTLGVGEVVNLTLNPAPPCSVTWSKSGNGALSATSGNSITLTAHEQAGTTTVTANIGGTLRQKTFTVVEPQSESAVKISDSIIAPGVSGAGMNLQITIAPTTVSFQNVESQEVNGPASSITGYFLQFNASQLAHTTAGWVPIAAGNLKFDVAQLSGSPQPWSAGGFQWVIPIQWRVIGKSYIGTLPNRVQAFSITSNGTVTVSKLGQSVTRSP